MDFEAVVRDRYSARKFRPDPFPRIPSRASWRWRSSTPSWCNCQPWQLVITRGAGTERLRAALYEHARAARPRSRISPFLPPTRACTGSAARCGVQLYQAVGIGRDDRAAAGQSLENFRLFGAPHVAIVTTEADLGVYGAIDCGLYVQTFMLAARDLGVDTIAQAALASYPQLIREILGLPEQRRVVCGISFGFAEQGDRIHSYRTERAPIADAVQFADH